MKGSLDRVNKNRHDGRKIQNHTHHSLQVEDLKKHETIPAAVNEYQFEEGNKLLQSLINQKF